MGDGDAVLTGGATSLALVPRAEFERIAKLGGAAHARASIFADACRLNVLYMVKRAGSGHLGTSFSSLDIMTWLFLEELSGADVFFSSKGHDAPALYSVLVARGVIPFEAIHDLRRLGGLPGHPHVGTPGIVTNTGSLGMGISKAKGMVRARRMLGKRGRVFVLLGDGELQEGQVWESLQGAARDGMREIVAIVDANGIQSDTWCADVLDMTPLADKFRAFGWRVATCDGNDPASIAAALADVRDATGPSVILAKTVKGKGVAAIEGRRGAMDGWQYRYHSGAPSDALYGAGVREIRDRVDAALGSAGQEPLRVETLAAPAHRDVRTLRRLLPAYTEALLDLAAREPRVVALDADLILDTGLIPFRDRFPERFIECGIAEQDMVSQAGGLAREGLVPIVHSFAAFLSARPNEQIYNNATEGSRIVYVGSLAGLVPGGPGHSHQAVRDVSALAAVPGMEVVEPCCEAEVKALLERAVLEHDGPTYLRLASVACEIRYALPVGYRLAPGRGVILREGRDATILTHGPILLDEAIRAAETLAAEGVDARVVSLPWLNRVEAAWLAQIAGATPHLVLLDDQYARGGQAEMILAALAELRLAHAPRVTRMTVEEVPACGKNDEVLAHHGLDAASIATRIREARRGGM